MQIVVLADASQREDLSGGSSLEGVVWVETEHELFQHADADVFIDLGFVNVESRVSALKQLLPKPIIINSVVATLQETNPAFVRINGWNTFLSSSLIEAATLNDAIKTSVEKTFAVFNKKVEWLHDRPGFVAARAVSMILNEALSSLKEGISTKEEIDTAMRLGTAYPYGPFQWAEEIGLSNVLSLIMRLGEKNVETA